MRISDWSSDVCSSDLRVFLAKNPDSALKLGQARGAAICAVVARDLPVHEYSPMQIKNAVVGRGAAEKGQVQHMIRSEEHTSELQSLMRISYAVFCLKKKKEQQTVAPIKITQIDKRIGCKAKNI